MGPDSSKRLERLVLAKLEDAGLNAEVVEDMPFGLCSVDELEKMVQLIQQTSIQAFMEPKVSKVALRLAHEVARICILNATFVI